MAQDETGISKGYGFVQFEKEEFANQCIERLNGLILNGRKVYVGQFVNRQDREKESAEKAKRYTNVYINNIDIYFKDKELSELFARFGTIISTKVCFSCFS